MPLLQMHTRSQLKKTIPILSDRCSRGKSMVTVASSIAVATLWSDLLGREDSIRFDRLTTETFGFWFLPVDDTARPIEYNIHLRM